MSVVVINSEFINEDETWLTNTHTHIHTYHTIPYHTIPTYLHIYIYIYISQD